MKFDTPALADIGPQLLGRKPNIPDERDYVLAPFLSPNPLDAALATLIASKGVAAATKTWAKAVTTYLDGQAPTPVPPIPPTPAPVEDVVWDDLDAVLDQGQTPHCGGFGGVQWGNTAPVDDHYKNADGHALYYEVKVIEGEPGAEDGVASRDVAKALVARGRLKTYAFASSVDEIRKWVSTKGPIMAGTNWYNDMFSPNADGVVTPTGPLEGGHFYVIEGNLESKGLLVCLNSWSAQWGINGRFYITYADFGKLLAQQGDAIAAVELP